jgi:hypothetical protein
MKGMPFEAFLGKAMNQSRIHFSLKTFGRLMAVSMALFLAACLKNTGSDETPTFSSQPSLTGAYRTDTDSYMRATGPCNGNSQVKITYSSALTTQNSLMATCKNDAFSLDLPVQSGLSNQTFALEVRGFKLNKFTVPIKVSFPWTPLPAAVAGFGVTSGGGIVSTGATASIINSSAGVPEGDPATLTAAGVKARIGIQGVLDP